MTSLEKKDAKEFANAVRSHWHVENKLHWVLDVAFREDHARLRANKAAQNAAVLRRIAVNILKQDKENKVGIQTKRKKALWNISYMEKTLMGATI